MEKHIQGLDKYHTHFLLLDDGSIGRYLTDRPRSGFVDGMCKLFQCHAVTIIVEGGPRTLDVILNDLKAKRPVVIVHGSGRLSNVLGNLLMEADDKTNVS